MECEEARLRNSDIKSFLGKLIEDRCP